MKPIIRWTIGAVKQAGLKCLLYSINSFRRIYGDIFEYYIMYNNINLPFIDNTNMVRQGGFIYELPYKPRKSAWKLYPPRLNINVVEIFIDNDLVLLNRLPEIDALLNNGTPFMTEGLYRNFGKYDSAVNQKYVLNSGLFGLPVGFDFGAKIRRTNNNWSDYYDEQGLVASIMTAGELNIVSRSRIGICRPADYLPNASHGFHFCGLNNSDSHNGWGKFINLKRGSIKLG